MHYVLSDIHGNEHRFRSVMEQIRLQPGETDGAQWVDFETVHQMIREKQICHIISKQFLQEEPLLRSYQQEE